MSRSGHQGHRRTCGLCGQDFRQTNWLWRYLASNGQVVQRSSVPDRFWTADKRLVPLDDVRRVPLHVLGCARRLGLDPYTADWQAARLPHPDLSDLI